MFMLRDDQPLWLPKGSIRAVLALAIIGTYVAGLHDRDDLALAAVAFYFGSRP